MAPKFPVLGLTVLTFCLVAAATQDVLVGGVLIAVILPLVLLGQWCVRWLFRRFRSPVLLRRAFMLAPALMLAFGIFRETNNFGGRQRAAVSAALAGNIPTGIRELHVREVAWTDYWVTAYFRCDPISLARVLEQPPFIRDSYKPDTFSFAETPFPDLHSGSAVHDVVVFSRTDLKDAKGSCRVVTDSTFSFAYLTFAVD